MLRVSSWVVRSLYTKNMLPRSFSGTSLGVARKMPDISKLRLTQSQVELEVGLSLATIIFGPAGTDSGIFKSEMFNPILAH